MSFKSWHLALHINYLKQFLKGIFMKKYILGLVLAASVSSFALTQQEQARVYENLNVARQEIQTLKQMLPGFARKVVEPSLNSIDSKIALSQSIVGQAPVQNVGGHVCVVKTSFDGSFIGKGDTQTEASYQAIQKCNIETDNGIWCRESNMKCEKSN
jgi:hypothetical protein